MNKLKHLWTGSEGIESESEMDNDFGHTEQSV